MGLFSSFFSGVSSAFSQPKAKDDPNFKKYAEEVKKFEVDSKLTKSAHLNDELFLDAETQNDMGDINSIDDVKKHFSNK